jgi:hypothetical protein
MLNKEEASLWRKMILRVEKLLNEMSLKQIDHTKIQENKTKNKYFEHLYSPRFF